MENAVEVLVGKQSLEPTLIKNVPAHEFELGMLAQLLQVALPPEREIIDRHHTVTQGDKGIAEMASYEARPARNENKHLLMHPRYAAGDHADRLCIERSRA